MSTTDMRLEALERRLAELEGREVASRALLTVLARTLVQTGIRSPQDMARTIDGWDEFFEPARANNLPEDHGPIDALRRQYFHAALDHFFAEVRRALPRPSSPA